MSNELVKSQDHLPDFMRKADGQKVQGVDELRKFMVPPRIKIVQKQSGAELLDRFNVGALVVQPSLTLLVDRLMSEEKKPRQLECSASFFFSPLFFFVEYCRVNPIQLRGQEPMIIARTFDPKDPIAIKARNPETRKENHPRGGDLFIRNVEFLNYIIFVHGHAAFEEEPILMSFSKGENFSGSKFANLISMRKADIYGCVFEAHSQFRTRNANDWFGIDVDNPKEDAGFTPFLQDKAQYLRYAEMHKFMKAAHADKKLRPEYDHPDEAEIIDEANAEM